MLVALLVAGACQPTLTPEESAAVFVVQDMLEHVPPEGSEITRRFIAPMWQAEPPVGPVFAAAIEASALAAMPLDAATSADSATLVLNLFRPRALGGDSLLVVAEWLILEPGEVFWGTQYEYTLKCTSSCELMRRHGPGYLN
jgi:hypothetical protein